MIENGFIKLHRSMVSWEWWHDMNTWRLFSWLLLSVNWKDGRFAGYEIPRGSIVTSYPKMAAETDLSVKQVRTALNHLKRTGEVAVKTTPKFSIITVNNYCKYQDEGRQKGSQGAVKGQSEGSQRATIEEYKESKKGRKKEEGHNTYLELITEMNFSDQINAVVTEWLRYKQEKKQTYQKSGFKQLLNAIGRDIEKNGEDHVINCFRYSMTNNYSGVFFDRKEEDNGKSKGETAPVKRDEYREWMHQQLHSVSEV